MAARRRRRRPWLLALTLPFAGFVLGVFAVSVYAERKLSLLVLGGLGESFSTRLYSSSYSLRDGSPCPPTRLIARLDSLGYQKAAIVARAGDYAWTPPSLEVFARGFRTPLETSQPGHFLLRWDGARWEVRTASGASAGELHLEPGLAAELSGARKVRREPSDSDEIPKALKDAVVAVEDKRFYTHWGVDPRGIARALLSNVRGKGPMQGGSTITQQLSKNLFLSPDRSLKRKAAEAVLALYMDIRYSKDRLLTIYLNHIYLGQEGSTSIAGMKAAARFYFGRGLRELTVAECATLAGLIRSPHHYNPFREPEQARQRRDFVLRRMGEEGFLTKALVERERAKPLVTIKPKTAAPRHDNDYFVAEVVRQLLPRLGEETLFRHGLSVYTTLDAVAQRDAQRAVASARPQAALIALQPRTGAVIALSGGRDFTVSQFNRATQARRQPGSTFKPFVYAAAFEKGFTPASILIDAPRKYPRDSGAGSTWDPRNYEGVYLGTTTMRVSLARSLNAATLDLAGQVGMAAVLDLAARAGIESALAPHLGTALGASEVTLYELAGAYAPFAADGLRRPLRVVSAVTDADGAVIEADPPRAEPVMDPALAWLTTSLLRSAITQGTGKGLAALGWTRPTAGKTGTTNDGRDAWFVGYTPELLAAVWVGDDAHKKLRATGAKTALPVWARFMTAAGQELDDEDFPRPPGIAEVSVDPASGLLAISGCPTRITEVFKDGTQPTRECPLHPTGMKGFFQRLFRRGR